MKCVTTMVRPSPPPCSPLLAASLLGLPAEAQWKWRDKAGHVQYSDLPPPRGTPEQDILLRPTAGARRAGAGARRAGRRSSPAARPPRRRPRARSCRARPTPSSRPRRKKAEADAAAKDKAEEQRIAAAQGRQLRPRQDASCSTLESGIRLARANAKGEREFLDDEQRAEETRRTKDVIATDCK